MSDDNYVLVVDCPDRRGVVAAVSTFIAQRGGLILEASHFREPAQNRSFMRTLFTDTRNTGQHDIESEFGHVAAEFSMQWSLWPSARKCKVLIAVSKQDHCLNSLLHRWNAGTLPIDIAGVVSNHDDNRRLVEWYGLSYHHLPIVDGWNYGIRMYEPEPAILDGTWTFPPIRP
ncbi:MAG: ACT domain-containing protein, partial [Gammaproteobacteria bacterium]